MQVVWQSTLDISEQVLPVAIGKQADDSVKLGISRDFKNKKKKKELCKSEHLIKGIQIPWCLS